MGAEPRDSFTELRSGLAELHEAVRLVHAEMRTSAAETCAYVDEWRSDLRRRYDVVGESLRGEIRLLAEALVFTSERADARGAEHGGRTARLEGRVLKIEARTSVLERRHRPRRRRK